MSDTIVEVLIPGLPGPGLPVGGATGQVARKKSTANYDVEWADPSAVGFPQALAPTDSPTFAGLTLSGLAANGLLFTGTGGALTRLPLGAGLSIVGGALVATGTGTVTSVGLSAPAGFSITGSPVTGSGTLTLGFAAGYSLPTDARQAQWDSAVTLAGTAVQPGALAAGLAGKAGTGAIGSSGLTMATLRILGRTSAGDGPIEQISVVGATLADETLTITGATDLSYDAATRTVASSTGADAVLTLADGVNAGLMSSADYLKLLSLTFGVLPVPVYNNTGATIAKGTPVYVTGSSGTRITIAPADASAEATAARTLGLTSAAIASNAEGTVIAVGELTGLNTSTLAEGQIIWLSETTEAMTTTRPTQPAHGVVLGYCVKQGAGSSGIVYVKVDNGLELDELHDVLITGKATGQALMLAADGLWKNRLLIAADLSDSTASGRAVLTGTPAQGRTALELATVATTGAYGDLSGRPTLFDPASPGAIGGTTPAAGTFTGLSASTSLLLPSGAAGTPVARHLYAVANTLRYRDSGNAERLLLNATDNLANLANAATARTNLGAAGSGAVGSSGLTMATARLLGRTTAGSGAVEEITLGSGLSFSGTTLNASSAPAGSSGQLQWNNGGNAAGLGTSSIDGSGNLTFSGRWIVSTNGAASAPPVAITGTWFTGGTATTTKPQLLIEPAGTTSTSWSTSGTGFGVNAPSGFAGDLAWFGVNGVMRFKFDNGNKRFHLYTDGTRGDCYIDRSGPGNDPAVVAVTSTGTTDFNFSSFRSVNAPRFSASNIRSSPDITSSNIFDSYILDTTGLDVWGYAGQGNRRITGGNRFNADEIPLHFEIRARDRGTGTSSWVNTTGSHLYLAGGAAVSGATNAANGGHVYLDSGRGFGTGADGNIIVGAIRGNLEISDARNIVLSATTGTRIGTSTTQKLAFWNGTPVVQPTAVADATDAASVITQLNALLSRLRTIGIIAT